MGLQAGGHEVVYEKDAHTLVGRRRPERRCLPLSETPYPHLEVAAVVVDAWSLETGIAQKRFNLSLRWKARRPAERWIALMVPRAVDEESLFTVRGHDQIVRWSMAVYPTFEESAPQATAVGPVERERHK